MKIKAFFSVLFGHSVVSRFVVFFGMSVLCTVSVAGINQTITITVPSPPSSPNESFFEVAAIASSGLPVVISVADANCMTAGGNWIMMMTSVGVCTVHFNQPGNATYNPAPQVSSFTTATGFEQSIIVTTSAPATAIFNTTFTVAATSDAGLPVAISASGGCTNVAGTVTMTSGSTDCVVNYSQAGNMDYAPAETVTNSTAAVKAGQSVSVSIAPPVNAAFASTFPVAATATSGLAVGIAASGGCIIAAGMVTMISDIVTCSLNFFQNGNDNYTAASSVGRNTTPYPVLYPMNGIYKGSVITDNSLRQ